MNAIIAFILRMIFLLLSYIFLGWMVYTIFSDLKQGKSQKKGNIEPPITLLIQNEDMSLTKSFRKPEIILGRDPAADFLIQNETISLRHCKISHHHKQWWVEDLGSTNGTHINSSMITSATVLTDGDLLQLGKVEISIKFLPDLSME